MRNSGLSLRAPADVRFASRRRAHRCQPYGAALRQRDPGKKRVGRLPVFGRNLPVVPIAEAGRPVRRRDDGQVGLHHVQEIERHRFGLGLRAVIIRCARDHLLDTGRSGGSLHSPGDFPALGIHLAAKLIE